MGIRGFKRSELETQSRVFKLTSERGMSFSRGGAGESERVSHIQSGDLDQAKATDGLKHLPDALNRNFLRTQQVPLTPLYSRLTGESVASVSFIV